MAEVTYKVDVAAYTGVFDKQYPTAPSAQIITARTTIHQSRRSVRRTARARGAPACGSADATVIASIRHSPGQHNVTSAALAGSTGRDGCCARLVSESTDTPTSARSIQTGDTGLSLNGTKQTLSCPRA